MAVEGVGNNLPKFDVIKFTTSRGENCEASKKDGVVTIVGDQNGVRQMPLEEFMPAFIEDQQKVQLERTPEKDEVSFKGITNVDEEPVSHRSRNAIVGGALGAIGGGIGGYTMTNPIVKNGEIDDNFVKKCIVADDPKSRNLLNLFGQETIDDKKLKEFLSKNKDILEGTKALEDVNLEEATKEQLESAKDELKAKIKEGIEDVKNQLELFIDKESGKFKELPEDATDAMKEDMAEFKNIAQKMKAKPAFIAAAATAAVLGGATYLMSKPSAPKEDVEA